jgi:hypothetical protein
MASMQEVVDDRDRCWSLVLKQWTSNSGNTPRPIFVLERTAECVTANKGAAGFFLQLWTNDGQELRISILSPPEFQADSSTASDWRQPSLNVVHKKSVEDGNHCSRNSFAQNSFKPGSLEAQLLQLRNTYDTDPSRSNAFRSSYVGQRGETILKPSDRNASYRPYTIPQAYEHAFTLQDSSVFQNASVGFPEWVRVRCGHAIGDLHVPSMQVTTVNLRTNTCLALSLAEFEESGGQGVGQWQTSIIVEDCGLPLTRWLSLWEQQQSQNSTQLNQQEQTRVHAQVYHSMPGPSNHCQHACHGYAQSRNVQGIDKTMEERKERLSPENSESNEGVSSRITNAKPSIDPATATATEVLLSFCQGTGSIGNVYPGQDVNNGAYIDCVASRNILPGVNMGIQHATESLPAEPKVSCLPPHTSRPQVSYINPTSANLLYENITKEVMKRKQFQKEEEERRLQDLARQALAMKVLSAFV